MASSAWPEHRGSGVVPPLPKFNPADTFFSSLKYIRNRPFLTKWWDLLDLSQVKKTFGSGLYAPWRGAYCYALIFFAKCHLRNTLVLIYLPGELVLSFNDKGEDDNVHKKIIDGLKD